MARPRDIDYAAAAVKKAIVEKFKSDELADLEVQAGETTIAIMHAGRIAEGARDDLQTAVRKAPSYASFWETLLSDGRFITK